MEDIEKAVEKMALCPKDFSKDQIHDDLAFLTGKAKGDVNVGKSHSMRTVNEDKAR